jgi:hypothetical protein
VGHYFLIKENTRSLIQHTKCSGIKHRNIHESNGFAARGKRRIFMGKTSPCQEKNTAATYTPLAYIFPIKDISYLAQQAIKWEHRCKQKGHEINLFAFYDGFIYEHKVRSI